MQATDALALARDLTAGIDRILTPREVLAAFRELAAAHPGLGREVLGHDAAGAPIEAYRWGAGREAVLWYGYPDPGEGVGATALLALFTALAAGHPGLAALDRTWLAIPCLNLVDQPDGGDSIRPVMKTAAQEVDWCLHDPRPETTALVALARRERPGRVFPLHDEFHCREPLPVYCMVSEALPAATCAAVREVLAACGYAIDAGTRDDAMGAGFARMQIAPDYANSTFSVMAEAGRVFICEVSAVPAIPPREMVATQLAACLAVMG